MTRLNSMIRFAAAAVLAVAITTLGVEDTQAADRPGLVVAVNKLPRGLEPAVRTGTVDVRVTYSIFDTLIRRDFQNSKKGNSSKLMPGLATSWKRISPTTVELELRKGVKFHNGDPFTADDVLFTFSKERLRGKKAAIPKGRRYFGNIAKVEKLNDFKVRFIAKKPDLVLEQRLASYTAWIVSKNAYYKFKADGEAAAKAEMEKMKAAKADGKKTAKKKKKKKKPKPHWMNLAIKKLTWNPSRDRPLQVQGLEKRRLCRAGCERQLLSRQTGREIRDLQARAGSFRADRRVGERRIRHGR